jgi:hypothetical protein
VIAFTKAIRKDSKELEEKVEAFFASIETKL